VSYIGFDGYVPSPEAQLHAKRLLERALAEGERPGIVNPCGEVPLAIWGGFCLIGDLVPYHAIRDGQTSDMLYTRIMDAAGELAKFLIRTNLMRSLYRKEVERTNRIGVGLTGIHEFAWKQMGLMFRDLISKDNPRAIVFWDFIAAISRHTVKVADQYSRQLGLVIPQTVTTMKPSGTVSKLWALTEGGHLPSRLFYLRWVQFTVGDPLIQEYKDRGYPVRGPLRTYKDVEIVGFPTRTELARIMPADKVVTAAEATFEEQCQWVSLLEHHWLVGGGAHPERAGQVSYTLKYDPEQITQQEFHRLMGKWMPRLKALSVMPQENTDKSAYEYLPEEVITQNQYDEMVSNIDVTGITEDVSFEHIDCASGACPIDFADEK